MSVPVPGLTPKQTVSTSTHTYPSGWSSRSVVILGDPLYTKDGRPWSSISVGEENPREERTGTADRQSTLGGRTKVSI